jgi:hypothetical protein
MHGRRVINLLPADNIILSNYTLSHKPKYASSICFDNGVIPFGWF